MDLKIIELSEENREELLALQVFEHQKNMIETVGECIEESLEYSFWRPVGIYDGDTAVGFAMYGKIDAENGRVWLDRLLIDKNYQGMGYGKLALKQLVKRLFELYGCESIYLSVYDDNHIAKSIYERFGFIKNGERDFKGEAVMVLSKDDFIKKHESITRKFFPMYVDLNDKKAVVIGAGKIAARRIKTLTEFCSDITVIADSISDEVSSLEGKVKLVRKKYERGDCNGYDIVIAATDNRSINHAVFEECRKNGTAVNVCDCKEECSFYFPAVITDKNVVVGVTASGKNHKLAKRIADNIRKLKDSIFNDKA